MTIFMIKTNWGQIIVNEQKHTLFYYLQNQNHKNIEWTNYIIGPVQADKNITAVSMDYYVRTHVCQYGRHR